MIEVTGLSKRYGNHLAVKDVSFSIDKGEVVGFLGPNGAGKSTIMNIITGYLSLTQGKAEIDGFDVSENPEDAKRRIGYLPEIPPLYIDMKVREYLNFIYDLKKVKFPKGPHIDEVMRLVKIDNVQNRLIKNLSKGYRQRVGFAQALIGNPDVLILDEPTVGLDPKQRNDLKNLIARLGKNHTVILSSHVLSEIEAVCQRILIINNGEIIADGTPDMLSSKLSGDLSLTLRAICNEEELMPVLSAIKGVRHVASLGVKEQGTCDFSIVPEDGVDIRAEVSKRVTERGKTILSLTSSNMSLEQVFLRLTNVTDNDEARRMLGLEVEAQSDEAIEEEE